MTGTVVDLRARLETQRASVQRVRQLLDEATSISEIVAVENELADRQAELESLQARYAALAVRVAMSTISLHLSTAAGAAQDQTDIGGPLAAGWDAFLGFGAAALAVLAAALPFVPRAGTHCRSSAQMAQMPVASACSTAQV